MLAGIGGLHRILKLIFKNIGGQFNRKNIMAKYIRNLYYIEKSADPERPQSPHNLFKNKFTSHLMTLKLHLFNDCLRYSHRKKHKNIDQKAVY